MPTEGALAPAPLRELPGKRRRERNWKDEVRERVDRRRQQVQTLSDGPAPDLPLFADAGELPLAAAREDALPSPPRSTRSGRSTASVRERASRGPQLTEAPRARRGSSAPAPAPTSEHSTTTTAASESASLGRPAIVERPARQAALELTETSFGVQDAWTDAAQAVDNLLVREPSLTHTPVAPELPLMAEALEEPPVTALAGESEAASRAAADAAARVMELGPDPTPGPGVEMSLGEQDEPTQASSSLGASGEWSLRAVDEASERSPGARRRATLDEPAEEDWGYLAASRPAGRPVERPAEPLERVQAGLVDLGVLVGLAGVVVWGAARMAKVPLEELRPTWPYLLAYCLFLACVYASYFTGTTGQTIGKILFGLRVVDTAGRAPGYGRALLRGILGALASLAAGLGLATMFLDPARRALHDRLCGTRVVSPGQVERAQ
jgi:uncharacterized RDD family membrane protein YckC